MTVNLKSIPQSGSFKHLSHEADWKILDTRNGGCEMFISVPCYFDETGNDLEINVVFPSTVITDADFAQMKDWNIYCAEILANDGEETDLDPDYADDFLTAFFNHIRSITA